jgi:hypothetical protein
LDGFFFKLIGVGGRPVFLNVGQILSIEDVASAEKIEGTDVFVRMKTGDGFRIPGCKAERLMGEIVEAASRTGL